MGNGRIGDYSVRERLLAKTADPGQERSNSNIPVPPWQFVALRA
jgi:hypothetical protein